GPGGQQGDVEEGRSDPAGPGVGVQRESTHPGGRPAPAATAGPADGRRAGTGARHGVLRRTGRSARAQDGGSRRVRRACKASGFSRTDQPEAAWATAPPFSGTTKTVELLSSFFNLLQPKSERWTYGTKLPRPKTSTRFESSRWIRRLVEPERSARTRSPTSTSSLLPGERSSVAL